MALAEWGLWDDEIDEIMLVSLTKSWIRRKLWEQKTLANELAKVLGGRSGGGNPKNRKVSANQFLAMTGVTIQ